MYFKENSLMFSFDLPAAYHHLEMFYPHTEVLVFSWILEVEQRFFKFLVFIYILPSHLVVENILCSRCEPCTNIC